MRPGTATRTARILAVAGLVAGALLHASAFASAAGRIDAAGFPAAFEGALKALWLGQSAALLMLAALVARAEPAGLWPALLAFTWAGLLAAFAGNVVPAWLMFACGILIVAVHRR